MDDVDLSGFDRYRSPFANPEAGKKGTSREHLDWHRHCQAWMTTGDERRKEYMLNFVTIDNPPADKTDYSKNKPTSLVMPVIVIILFVIGIVLVHLV